MSPPSCCWVILDPHPQTGTRNMSEDEALLEAAATRNQCTLRWYGWSEATVSLGYFQAIEEALADSALSRLPHVRRLTGGGAIVHHHELTYSCALPPTHPLARAPRELYRVIHEEIVNALRDFGVPARVRGPESVRGAKPFLCFGREDQWDVVCEKHKILGSAQRRHKNAVLQHGSLLLYRSEHAPCFPGLLDLVGSVVAREALAERLADRVAAQLARQARRTSLSEVDDAMAVELEELRYSRPEWNAARRFSRVRVDDEIG